MSSAILPPRTQTPCCYTSALDASATYCGDCGKPLMRCMAAEECGGLLDDHGLCTVCVTPHLQIDAGAMIAARVGGALAVPISVANLSVVGRPLFVTNVWSREAGGEWQPQALGWERLAAGETAPLSITADKLERAGAHSLDILVALASRWRWRQECYAFSASLRLTVEDESSASGPVVNIGGDSAGHGNVVYIGGQDGASSDQARAADAITLPMVRADREERMLGLRGLGDGIWVPKSTQFRWIGFAKDETPPDGPLLTPDGLFAAGRSRTRRGGGPGDIRLLVQDQAGKVDEDLSRLISRRQFEFYIECDRLMLRVTSEGGIRINGEAFGPSKTIQLKDGDIISPIVKSSDLLSISVKFHVEHGAVGSVSMTRIAANA